MVLALEAEPSLQELRDTIDYFIKLPVVLAGFAVFAIAMYLDQALEDFTLMMALEADGDNPFRWKEYIQSGKVKILPSPPPGYPGYPDIDRYDILYPSLYKP